MTEECSSAPRGWSDLPELILSLIVFRLPDLSDIVCFAAVCRSWHLFLSSSADVNRLLSSRFFSSRPPLLLLPRPHRKSPFRIQSVERPGIDSIGVDPILNPKSSEFIALGYSHGHLIFQIVPSHPEVHLVICNPFTGQEISPPPAPPDDFPYQYRAAALSAPPSSPDSFLILFTPTSVVYRRLNSHNNHYTIYPLQHCFMISSVLPFKLEKQTAVVYAINTCTNQLMELLSADDEDDELVIKVHWLEPFFDFSYNNYEKFYLGPSLTEFDEKLLMVIFIKKNIKGEECVMWLQVAWMDFEEMRWGDANDVLSICALFVDTRWRSPAFVLETEEWGGRCWRLYLAEQEGNGWMEFALEYARVRLPSSSRSVWQVVRLHPEYPCPPLVVPKLTLPRCCRPSWVYPNFSSSSS